MQALALVCTPELRTACFSFALWSPVVARLVSGTVQLVVEGSTQELAIRGQLGFESPLLSLLLVMHWSLKGKTEFLIVYIFQLYQVLRDHRFVFLTLGMSNILTN